MAGIEITFEPWRSFYARRKDEVIRGWLDKIGKASQDAMQSGMASSSVPSAPGDWPGVRKGSLMRSIRYVVTGIEMLEVGTNMPYSGFLRFGTSRMSMRDMSDEALEAGLEKGGRLTKWVEWAR